MPNGIHDHHLRRICQKIKLLANQYDGHIKIPIDDFYKYIQRYVTVDDSITITNLFAIKEFVFNFFKSFKYTVIVKGKYLLFSKKSKTDLSKYKTIELN